MKTDKEIWLVCADYPHIEVSNMGRVRTRETQTFFTYKDGTKGSRTNKPKLLTPTDNGHGYLIVPVVCKKPKKNAYVHRLVAKAFLEGYEDHLVVDHINHDRGDNRASNLQWVTQKENVLRSVEMMRKPRSKCRVSNTGEKYISRRKNGRYAVFSGKQFDTLAEALAYRKGVIGW